GKFDSVLYRIKIIKVLGLAFFSLKISALCICETLALVLTATICLTCLIIALPGPEMSRYTRIFDIFIGKTSDDDKVETFISDDFLISDSCSVMYRSLIYQQQITRLNPSISSILSTVESKVYS
ncbi:unnamed protein product, partial [Rotaria sp. Silwood2]